MANRTFQNAYVGTTGRRRLVPMLGIDFIAGQIARKRQPLPSRSDAYGLNPASIGGRTRKWSTINFLNLQTKNRYTNFSSSQLDNMDHFTTASKSADRTVKNPAVITAIQIDWKNATVRQGVNPNDYATARGWVFAVRMAQIADGVQITPTTDTWTWT